MARRLPAAEPPARFAAAEPLARFAAVGRVLVDSGPLLALFNAADRWHAPVLKWLQDHPEAQLISTWPVATEVCALLARRGALGFDLPEAGSLAEVLTISERFHSLPFDLADASIAEAAARLKLRHVLSIDADFDVYRDRGGKALVNLLKT